MSTPTRSHRLRARWVFPVDGPPIEDGVIEIERGRITRLGSGPDAEADDLGNVAVIPGLVNAHTHLEFSDLRRPLAPALPFPAWIRAVIAHRRHRTGPRIEAINNGLRECREAGITLVGDITTNDVTASGFDACSPSAVVFREVLGIAEADAAQQLTVARRHLSHQDVGTDGRVLCGLSPHAPYSVSAELFHECVQLAGAADAPVAMHLAETREELELLQSGTGPLVEFLKSLGVWRDRFWLPGGTIRSYLEVLSRAPRALVVHGNYLDRSDIEFLSRHPQMTVAFCPRTHRFFRHTTHPWQAMLAEGVSVALGTDSRASNPDLSLWREVQFLKQSDDGISGDTLLELATLRGAAALGREDETGSLSPGKSADLAIVGLCDDALSASFVSATEVLLHPGNSVVATMQSGSCVHRRL